jgi:hypothetical protein
VPAGSPFDPDDEGAGEGRGRRDGVVDAREERDRPDADPRSARHDGRVARADRRIGEIVALLERRFPAGDTLLVLTSDPGAEPNERGRAGDEGALPDGSSHIPLLFVAPGRVTAGARVRAPAAITDVAPTILDLVGAEPLPAVAGRSLAPWILADGDRSSAGPARRARAGEPAERTPAELETLRRVHPAAGAPSPDLPAEVREKLERLGYVGAGSRPGAREPLWAAPDPVPCGGDPRLGRTRLFWDADRPGARVEVRVGAPDGRTFASGGERGSAETGEWVADGLAFFLVEVESGEVLGRVVADLSGPGCSGG